jgi:hypothetical protein
MSKEKKKAIGLKINLAVDAAIRQAAEKRNLSYIDIIEKGAGKLARQLLRQNKPAVASEIETGTETETNTETGSEASHG